MARLEIRLLGTFEVRRDQVVVASFASNKVRALLAFLAVEPGRAHLRESLASLLWPESSQKAALSSLRNALANLRQAIGDEEAYPPHLIISRAALQFNLDSDTWLDAAEIEKIAGGALRPSHEFSPGDVSRMSAALECYRGPFLAGFNLPDSASFEEWAGVWRERLAQRALDGLGRMAAVYETCGEWSSALAFARRRVALDPWLEDAHRQVMRILALSGQNTEALAQYNACARILEADLGVSPSNETRATYETILAGNLEQLRSGEILPVPGVSPYRGLRFFEEGDADLFFGRETLTAQLAARVEEIAARVDGSPPVLAIVGASGSGKSSLVRAGLVPALRRSGWQVSILTPGPHPLAALHASPGSFPIEPQTPRSLLVVDQFEELFSLCREESERAAFLEILFDLGHAVVLVLRADFYGHCAAYPRLRAAISARQEYIGAMDAAGLRRAIEEPARRGGWELENGLTDLLLDEIGASGGREPEPGGLPLLEHALLETWQHRQGRQLTLVGYRASGGVRGAIAQTAERIYGSLSTDDQSLARKVFLRLTELGEGTSDTRRRAALFELRAIGSGKQPVDALLESLTAARLVTLSEGSAEVAHEALIREWPALQRWLTEDREGLRLHRHLTESAAAWNRLKRDEGELYRGARLAQAMDWAGQGDHAPELTALESTYLSTSQEHEKRAELERELQRQRELEAARKLAEAERRRAEEREEAAQRLYREERLAYALELTAHSNNKLATEQDLALLLALEAVSTLQDAGLPVPWDVQQSIHDVAMTSRMLWRREVPSATYMSAYAPDGKLIYYEGSLDLDNIWKYALDAESGEEIFKIRVDGQGLALSRDGKYLATMGRANACLWDAHTGKNLLTIPLQMTYDPLWVGINVISPNGRYLIVTIEEHAGCLIDLEPWRVAGSPTGVTMELPVKRIEPCSSDCPAVAFTPDSKTFTTANLFDSTITLWDTETVTPLRTFRGHTDLPRINCFSLDGSRMASSSYDSTIRLWDVASGAEIMRLSGHTTAIHSVTYSPDGKQLASASNDSLVILWNAASGRREMDLHAGGSAYRATYSPDGKRLFTTSLSSVLTLWDISPEGRGELGTALGSAVWVSPSPDGALIAESCSNGSVILLDAQTLQVQKQIALSSIPGANLRCSFSHDHSRLAMDMDGRICVWDLQKDQLVFDCPAAPGWDSRYAIPPSFSPGDTHIVVGGYAEKLRIWNLGSGQSEKVLEARPGTRPIYAEFSPDGRWLAAGFWRFVGSGGGDVWIWDMEDPGKPPRILNTDQSAFQYLCFSPDSQWLATCGGDPVSRIWSVESGQIHQTLRGHVGCTNMIRYSPDGNYLATASRDGSVKVWDASSGTGLLSYRSPNSYDMALASFTPDSRRVVICGGENDHNHYWLLAFQDFDELLKIVRARATRGWKPEERQRYLRRG